MESWAWPSLDRVRRHASHCSRSRTADKCSSPSLQFSFEETKSPHPQFFFAAQFLQMHFLGRTKRTPSYRHSHSHHYPSYAGCPSVPGQPLSRDFFFFKVSRLMGHLTYPLCAIVTFFIYHVRKPYQKGSETSGVIILEPAEAWPRARRTGRPHPMQPLRRRRRRRRRRWMPDPPTRLAVKPLQRQLSSTRGALTRGSHRLLCQCPCAVR